MAFTPPMAGELIRSVVFERREQTPTANGGLAEAWLPVATACARIQALFGGRTVEGVQTTERATHAVTVRYRADAEACDYLRADGRRYRVRSTMIPDDRRRWLELLAEDLGDA